VIVRNTIDNGTTIVEDVDTVVLVCGRRSRVDLVDAAAASGRPWHAIGDCFSPRRLADATLDGARLAVCL
jgi:hypothetical protein